MKHAKLPLIALFIAACAEQRAPQKLIGDPKFGTVGSWLETCAQSSTETQLFCRASVKTQVSVMLKSEDMYTVFAPSDTAVRTYLQERGEDETTFFDRADLTAFVKSHVSLGRHLLRDGEQFTTLAGTRINVTHNGDQVIINADAKLLPADQTAWATINGEVFRLDSVLK